MLLPLGFEILEAENGERCVEIARRDPPDVILLDLLMPVMDGFESARLIRQTDSIQHTPIIAISASVFEDTVKKSLEAGCDAFLFKPLELDTLLECLQKYLHVEWVYKSEEAASSDSALPFDAAVSEPRVVLPPYYCQELRKWAECGNVTRLLDLLAQIEALSEHYAPIVTELRKSTKSFQIHHILTYLDQMETYHDEKNLIDPDH
jgi:CheY-like chemotaxis protein